MSIKFGSYPQRDMWKIAMGINVNNNNVTVINISKPNKIRIVGRCSCFYWSLSLSSSSFSFCFSSFFLQIPHHSTIWQSFKTINLTFYSKNKLFLNRFSIWMENSKASISSWKYQWKPKKKQFILTCLCISTLRPYDIS